MWLLGIEYWVSSSETKKLNTHYPILNAILAP